MTMSGFVVGLIVGLTGIGGGALMTPLLVLIFGVTPEIAVGTDLVLACVTKLFGVLVHGQRGTVDWQLVRRLSFGSLPAAVLTVSVLGYLGRSQIREGIILQALAIVLLLTASGLLVRQRLHLRGKRLRSETPASFKKAQPALTVAVGVMVGTMVALTSVGAGALGTVALLYLYPFRLGPLKLVGTDMAHAIPLTLVAGVGHLMRGNLQADLLGRLLLGSIPGIVLGSTLSVRVPESFLRNAIAAVLVLVAARLLW